ncbi:hypothetical protein [Leuconostoc citreum]|uniref:hypothetical protein n=1 Tax=Leuconostoc citreum TaxID=33964 RepID=UPI0032DFB4B4
MPTKQTELNKAWQEKNKARQKYLNYRSYAKIFIRDLATEEDIEFLKELIEQRKHGEKFE